MSDDYWREHRRRRQEYARTREPCIRVECPAKVDPEDTHCHYCGTEQPFAKRPEREA
jgi:hypothetical protein